MDTDLPTCIPQVVVYSATELKCLSVQNVFEIAISELEDKSLDITPVSTPCSFRLLDCKRYIESQVVTIYEFPNIPPVSYSAISYPWVGNDCNDYYPAEGKAFRVVQDAGTLGDAISTRILLYACNLSVWKGANFLWIDRLCIRQRDRIDKSWQISLMCDVYRHCKRCIIVPSGLRRLAILWEETPWIRRMWTLQPEALVPSEKLVVYSSKDVGGGHGVSPPPDIPEAKEMGFNYATLEELLVQGVNPTSAVRLFFHPRYGFCNMLLGALRSTRQRGNDAGDDDQYRKHLSTWESAISRTADRPQDLLLSVMGLFDISIDSEGQRTKASIVAAFVAEFRKRGLADSRVVAFRDAVLEATATISEQWKGLISDIDQSLPSFSDRITYVTAEAFPFERAGPPVARDLMDRDVYLASALVVTDGVRSLHPCKVIPSRSQPMWDSNLCIVTHGSLEQNHTGICELLPFDPERMEWIPVSRGEVPDKREPVGGGYEKDAHGIYSNLYHALAVVNHESGRLEHIPGKTGKHLNGCVIGLQGKEVMIDESYVVLCWKLGARGNLRVQE